MKRSRILSLIIVACCATACHSVRRGEPITGLMQLGYQAKDGRIVFFQRCHQCHPNGEAGLGPALNNKPAPVFLMKTQVRAGFGAMPRFDEHAISSEQLDDLMAYLMTLRNADSDKSQIRKKDQPARVASPATAPPIKSKTGG